MTTTLGDSSAALAAQPSAPLLRPACEAIRADFRAYFRAELAPIPAKRVSAHLECCPACTAVYQDGLHMFD